MRTVNGTFDAPRPAHTADVTLTGWRLPLCVSVHVGVRNVTALGNVISWQKVDYDFNYHQMEFPCNINVLIASEGRSLLPVRTKVKM